MMTIQTPTTFNSAIEIGLRALIVLVEAFPQTCSLQRLVVFDYLIVHSDDIPDGPSGLHPKTPHRSGELLVRRDILRKGLLLYQSRNLIEIQYSEEGVYYRATESSAAFLDALYSSYVNDLKERAIWLIKSFGDRTDNSLEQLIQIHLGQWGAEFEMESVLWSENSL